VLGTFSRIALALAVISVTGCVNLGSSLVRGRAVDASAQSLIAESSQPLSWKALERDDPMFKIPVIRKITKTALASAEGRKSLPLTFHALDGRNILRVARENFGLAALIGRAKEATTGSVADPLARRITYYTALYLTGSGFVARDGTLYKFSKEEKNEMSSQVADALTTIIVEATLDDLETRDARLATPVWKTPKGKWATRGGNKPSVVDFVREQKRVRVARLGAPGEMTMQEHQAVCYLAELAAQQSKLTSGTTMRLFGKAEVSFGAGLGFSLGDNEILSTVVESCFENMSRRVTMHSLNRAITELADNPQFAAILSQVNGLAPIIAKAKGPYETISSVAQSR
jgi:hypothetical protein